jgi:hypothetical protein
MKEEMEELEGEGEGGASVAQGRWRRDWDVHLTLQVLGHDEARGFWKDLGTGMGIETREPHPVMSTSELSL